MQITLWKYDIVPLVILLWYLLSWKFPMTHKQTSSDNANVLFDVKQ